MVDPKEALRMCTLLSVQFLWSSCIFRGKHCQIICWRTMSGIGVSSEIYFIYARFIRTVCMRRIRWSCEGLTSVTQQIHWIQLKHLLLRHMYNLPLPKLCATLLVDPTALLESLLMTDWPIDWLLTDWLTDFVLYCAVPYIAACVDVSRTVFRDRSSTTDNDV